MISIKALHQERDHLIIKFMGFSTLILIFILLIIGIFWLPYSPFVIIYLLSIAILSFIYSFTLKNQQQINDNRRQLRTVSQSNSNFSVNIPSALLPNEVLFTDITHLRDCPPSYSDISCPPPKYEDVVDLKDYKTQALNEQIKY